MFFIIIMICDLLIPVIMIVAGYWMNNNPPKNINALFGYRTTMSMKNNDTWLFAHKKCGEIWMKIGFLILVPMILVHLPFVNSSYDTIGIVSIIVCAVEIIIMICSIVSVEKVLKNSFDENGIRKKS